MKDTLVKAIAGDFRIYAARTTTLVGEAVRRHDCHPVAAAALGRTMTGALLLAANLKNEEALTVKFAGDGPLGTVVADAVPEGFVRGCVDHPQADLPLNAAGKLDVGAGVGAGLVSVTRFTGLKEPVVGSCEILTGEIAEDLTKYLYDSEQTPSSVALGVLVAPDFTILAAGGFFVQPLPGASEEGLTRLEENLASGLGARRPRIARRRRQGGGLLSLLRREVSVHGRRDGKTAPREIGRGQQRAWGVRDKILAGSWTAVLKYFSWEARPACRKEWSVHHFQI